MKFCKDCKHYRQGGATLKAAFPDACRSGEITFDPVTGRDITYAGEPRDLRHDENRCGMSAKWFEPKEPK